jgi:type II secretory pathway pseudopilin PulG
MFREMKRKKGFSVIELMVVLLFFGAILAATLGYTLNNKDRRNLSSTAKEIVGEIYKIKQIAARENIIIRMTFTTDSYSYQYHDGVTWQPLDNKNARGGTARENVTIVSPPDLAVNSRGMILRPATLQLHSQQDIEMTAPRGGGTDRIIIHLYPYGGMEVEKQFI